MKEKIKNQIRVKLYQETIDKIKILAAERGVSPSDLFQEACNNYLDSKQLLSNVEAAEYLGISRVTLWRKVQAGDIPTVDIGGLVRYDKRQLDKIIESGK